MKLSTLFYIAFIFSCITFLSSCNSKTTYETVVTEQQYSLDLPSYLQKGTDLHETARLQYRNLLKEFYVVVIEDSKTEMAQIIEENALQDTISNNLQGYSDLIAAGFKSSPEIKIDSDFIDQKIGSLDAKYFNLLAKVEGLDVFYHYTLVEGKDTYYQIMQWTLADRKENHKAEMDKVAQSFKEL